MSAFKTWILFFGMAFLFVACSDDSHPHKLVTPEVGSNDSTAVRPDGSRAGVVDTITKKGESTKMVIGKDTVKVGEAEGSLYYSKGLFCWNEGCEKNFVSSSSVSKPNSAGSGSSGTGSSGSQGGSSTSKPSSSSLAPSISVDSTAPTFDKDGKKLTDNRDKQDYDVVKIGTVYWMEQNLRYKTSSGSYEYSFTRTVDGGEEITISHENSGRMYTYAAAQVACPSGWSLPTRQQTAAAIESQDNDWWTYSGRMDQNGEHGNERQAYLWISGQMESGDENYDKYKSDTNANALAFWVNGENATPGFIDNPKNRGYGVRCVTSE